MRFGFKVFGGLEARDEQRRCAAGRSSTKHKPAVVVSHHTTAPQPTSPPRSAWIHAEPGGMRSSRQPPSGVPNVPSPIARLLDDSGSLEPQNSILMTTKLHGYRSSMAVSGGLGGGWEAAARPSRGLLCRSAHIVAAAALPAGALLQLQAAEIKGSGQQRAGAAQKGSRLHEPRLPGRQTAPPPLAFSVPWLCPAAAVGEPNRQAPAHTCSIPVQRAHCVNILCPPLPACLPARRDCCRRTSGRRRAPLTCGRRCWHCGRSWGPGRRLWSWPGGPWSG